MNRRSQSWRRSPCSAGQGGDRARGPPATHSDIALSGRHVRSSLPLLPLHILGIAGGVGLMLLAFGLWHGKRRAAQVAIVALAAYRFCQPRARHLGRPLRRLSSRELDSSSSTSAPSGEDRSSEDRRRGPMPARRRSCRGSEPRRRSPSAVLAMGATQGTSRWIAPSTAASGVLPDWPAAGWHGVASGPPGQRFDRCQLWCSVGCSCAPCCGRPFPRTGIPQASMSAPRQSFAATARHSLDPFIAAEDKAFFFDARVVSWPTG